ncbi:MAG: flavodoxin family protein [archaeon]|nr:flavodoxin family protein [archaeon]
MKVVALNGSPRLLGNTSTAISVVLDELNKNGIETEHIQVYESHISPCNHCNSCEIRGDGRCVIEDDNMNNYLDEIKLADGVVMASPVYFNSCTAQIKMFLERAGRVCQFGNFPLKDKIGAAIAIQEHSGGSNAYAELVNWMLCNQMVVVGSSPICIISPKISLEHEKSGDAVILKTVANNMTRQLLKRNL